MNLPELGLGGGPLGNYLRAISDEQAEAVVAAAWEAGIRYFDTAPYYGLGLSEQRLGRALRGLPRRSYLLSTKAGRLVRPGQGGERLFEVPGDRHAEWDFSRDGVLRSLEESLDRLGVDRVDILLLHDPDHHWRQAVEQGFPALAELRSQGVVGAIGVGMNQSRMLVDFVKHTDPDVLLAANQLTLLRRTALEELVPLCASRGIQLVAGSVFHRGLLADPPQDAPPEVARLARACARHEVTLAAAAMRFPLRQPGVSSVLIGAHAPTLVKTNVEAFGQPIPEALWAELSA